MKGRTAQRRDEEQENHVSCQYVVDARVVLLMARCASASLSLTVEFLVPVLPSATGAVHPEAPQRLSQITRDRLQINTATEQGRNERGEARLDLMGLHGTEHSMSIGAWRGEVAPTHSWTLVVGHEFRVRMRMFTYLTHVGMCSSVSQANFCSSVSVLVCWRTC